MDEPEYGRCFKVGNQKFTLEEYLPDIQECRFILFKVLEQAVRDYIKFKDTDNEDLFELWCTAKGFLFDNTYRIDWGGQDISLSEILDELDLDIDWVRSKTSKRFEK